jgi:transposase
MVVADGHGLPIGLYVDSAQPHESQLADATLATVRVPQTRGRPRTRPKELVADKAYDSHDFRQRLRRRGIKPTIPTVERRKRRRPKRGRPIKVGVSYRQRWKVERCFGWMDHCRWWSRRETRGSRRPNSSSPWPHNPSPGRAGSPQTLDTQKFATEPSAAPTARACIAGGSHPLGGARRVRSEGTPDPRAHRCAGRGRRHPPWGECSPGLLDAQRLVGRVPTARATCPLMASHRTAMAPARSSRRPMGCTASPRTLMPYRSSQLSSDHVKKNLIAYLCIIIAH